MHAALALALAVMVMVNLMMYGVMDEHRRMADKAASELYVERLKRDYFEWRDSDATGHRNNKSAFPRAAELDALQSDVGKD